MNTGMSAHTTIRHLGAIPGVTLHADPDAGIKIQLRDVFDFPLVHRLVPLCKPVRVGATAVATSIEKLDGLPVTVTAPVMEVA